MKGSAYGYIFGLLIGVPLLAWGVAGAVVDGASDQYENSIYNDTIKYFRLLIEKNIESKGINIE